jgi:transposase
LKGAVKSLADQQFGRSSEKTSSDTAKAAGSGGGAGAGGPDRPESGAAAGGGSDADAETEKQAKPRRKRGQQPGSRGHGRRGYAHLDTEERVHDLPIEERMCGVCGAAYAPFAQETCDQIEWEVHLVRVHHVRPTYKKTCVCPGPGIIAAPPVPKPIAKGLFTEMFLARLLVNKYLLGQPLYRIGVALAHEGLSVAQGTLVGVLAKVNDLLAPLAEAIAARNRAEAHLHIDETSWRVYEPVDGKKGYKWWLWVFVGPDTTVFRCEPARSLAALNTHLGLDLDAAALPEGRRLLISADFYTVYQSIAGIDGIEPLWCWAHIRRYFIRAGKAHAELRIWAQAWVGRIGELYIARSAILAATPHSAQHTQAKAQFAAALADIDAERKDQAALDGQHPKAAKVLATLDREWDGLIRHGEHLDLALDNNSAERALRTPVVGRKNYYGAGSITSARLAARVWTITATITQAGINPLPYLTDYLKACAHNNSQPPTGAQLERFLPWSATPDDLTRWTTPTSPTPDHPTIIDLTPDHLTDHTGPAP